MNQTTMPSSVALMILLHIGLMAVVIRSGIKVRRKAQAFGFLYVVGAASLVGIFSSFIGLKTPSDLVLGLVCVLAPLGCYRLIHQRNLSRAVKRAPSLREWILANFAELDADNDGVITREDLDVFRDRNGLSAHNRRMANLAAYDLSDIGHVVDTVTAFAPMYGCGTFGGMISVNLYGIAPVDAQSHPGRIATAYDREFGS